MTAFLFENFSPTLYNPAITAAISDPTTGKEVSLLEIIIWLLKTVAEAVIRHGVSKVIDYLLKRK